MRDAIDDGPAASNSHVCRFLVFHGGSGSTKDEIKTAVQNGVVKMNVDTDTQWAYLSGVRVSPVPTTPLTASWAVRDR